MKTFQRFAAALAALLTLSVAPAFAAGPGRYMHWDRQYATDGDLPTCNGARAYRIAFSLDDGVLHLCNGSSWVSITLTGAEPSFDGLTIAGDADITGSLSVDNIDVNGNTISSTDADGNIVLDPNGTGSISAPAPVIGVTSLAVDNLTLNGNTIISTDTNGNIGLDPDGNGVTAITGPATVSTTLGVTGKLTLAERIVDTPQDLTVADSGDGSPATSTLTPSSSVVACTCNDTDGCAITLSETGAAAGQILIVFGVTANACTFADSAGVQETTGALSLGANDVVSFLYLGSTWAQSRAVVNN